MTPDERDLIKVAIRHYYIDRHQREALLDALNRDQNQLAHLRRIVQQDYEKKVPADGPIDVTEILVKHLENLERERREGASTEEL